MKKVLMHMCCAPCSVASVEKLRSQGLEVVGYWYNPNIHPYTEYRSRKETLIDYAKKIDMQLIVNDKYGLREFIDKAYNKDINRCQICYDMRLEETAKTCQKEGFDFFTTSLLISPYQNHQLLKERAEYFQSKYNVEFLYQDFRPLFRQGQQKARENQFYMQKYCGCIFSEEERYLK